MRTTGVRLIAVFDRFKKDFRDAKDEVEDFRRETDKAGAAGRKMGGDLDKTGASSRRLGDELDKTGVSGGRLRGMFDSVARSSRTSSHETDIWRKNLAEVDRQIKATKDSLGHLAKALNINPNDAGVTKAFREQQKQLNLLKDIRRFLPDSGDAEQAGAALGKSVGRGFLQVREGLIGPLSLLLAPLIATWVPTLAAAIEGAVIGGAGAGGVVGGLLIVAKDPRVVAAFDNVITRLDLQLKDAASGFVDAAILGMRQLEDVLARVNLRGLLSEALQFVGPLVKGIGDAVENIGYGLLYAFRRAGPVVDQFAGLIAQLGDTVAKIFIAFADHSAEAAAGLYVLGQLFDGLVAIVTFFLNLLADVFGVFVRLGFFGEKAKKIFDDVKNHTSAADLATRLYNNTIDDGTAAMGRYSAAVYNAKHNAEELKTVQQQLKTTQDGLDASLAMLVPDMGAAALGAKSIKTAMENLYGPQMAEVDANEKYHDSMIKLTKQVKDGGTSLGMHTKAALDNRDALEDLLIKSGELYLADVALGIGEDHARAKHEQRTEAIRRQAEKLHLDRTETQNLINTYGRIPGKKITELVLDGVLDIVAELRRLYVLQRALAEGRSIESMEDKLRKGSDSGPSKAGGGFAGGGYTGAGGKHDVAGVVHRNEYVVRSESTSSISRNHPGALDYMNRTGRLPGYARGGLVAPVDESRSWPFGINVSGTRIPSLAEVAARVAVAFGRWPASPGAQRGDSGVWRRILAMVRAAGFNAPLISAYRPGDPLWHGSGRADDFGGYNQDRLARFLAAKRPLELIHRTRNRDYAYTRGRDMGSFNNALMNAHRNHLHIAMASGGVIREPVWGVGASGASYSFAENGPEVVMPASQMGGGVTIVIAPNFYGPVGSQYELRQWLTAEVDALKRTGRL